MGINLSTIVTGHGPLRSYYHRFKIKDDPECVCRMGPQTTNHLIWECAHLLKQRETLENRIGRRKLALIELRPSQQLHKMVPNVCKFYKL